MSAQQTTNAEAEASKAGMSLDEKIGMAKKFDREMKDYAKATVKEFLGIYGYEEDVDINIDESETQKANETIEPDEKCTETDSSTTAVSTMTNTYDVEKGTGNDHPVSSVSISSSTANGNADMTRFCITMSIPRPDSLEGYTTLRFWNCIMCSTAFVGNKPEIIQRVHHPQLFTYQPEWLSHAGICNRCQKTLTMQAPKITIYAINETSQRPHGSTSSIPAASVSVVTAPGPPTPAVSTPGGSIPGPSIPHVPGTFVPGTFITGTSVPVLMCNALPGQCNCAHGGHNHVQGVSHLAYPGVNVPVVTKTEANPECTEAGYITSVTQYIPITCTQ